MLALAIACVLSSAPDGSQFRETSLSGLAINGPSSLVLHELEPREVVVAEALGLGDYKPVLMVTMPGSGPERAVFIETPDNAHFELVTRVAKESLQKKYGDNPAALPSSRPQVTAFIETRVPLTSEMERWVELGWQAANQAASLHSGASLRASSGTLYDFASATRGINRIYYIQSKATAPAPDSAGGMLVTLGEMLEAYVAANPDQRPALEAKLLELAKKTRSEANLK